MKLNITIEIDDEELKGLLTEPKRVTMDETGISPYARFFDEACMQFNKDSEHNLIFLKSTEEFCNERLKREGHLFLNDVYEMLGIPFTKSGQCVGWIYDEDHPIGNNFVSFSIYNHDNSKSVNGYGNTFLLDFNVDGNILNYL